MGGWAPLWRADLRIDAGYFRFSGVYGEDLVTFIHERWDTSDTRLTEQAACLDGNSHLVLMVSVKSA